MIPTKDNQADPQIISEGRRSLLSSMGLITEGDLANMLGIRLQTLWDWRRKGSAPLHTKLGRDTYYRTEDVRGWIAANVQVIQSVPGEANKTDFVFGHGTDPLDQVDTQPEQDEALAA